LGLLLRGTIDGYGEPEELTAANLAAVISLVAMIFAFSALLPFLLLLLERSPS
jgi:hypothetical protein